MKTFQNDIRETEEFISGKLDRESSLLFEVRLLIDPILKLNVEVHKKLHALVRAYGRKKIKEEAESIHQKLFQDPDRIVFQQSIYQLFQKK